MVGKGVKSEKDRLLRSLAASLSAPQVRMFIEVVGTKHDNGMSRVYTALSSAGILTENTGRENV